MSVILKNLVACTLLGIKFCVLDKSVTNQFNCKVPQPEKLSAFPEFKTYFLTLQSKICFVPFFIGAYCTKVNFSTESGKPLCDKRFYEDILLFRTKVVSTYAFSAGILFSFHIHYWFGCGYAFIYSVLFFRIQYLNEFVSGSWIRMLKLIFQ